MKLFITGGTGFIGSCFIECALNKGYEVFALTREKNKLKHKNLKWIIGDLNTSDYSEIKDSNVIVHMAAHGVRPEEENWESCFNVNVHGLLNLLESSVKYKINKYIILGSCFEYGRSGERYEFIPVDAPIEPIGPYATSKAAATLTAMGFARYYGKKLSIIRPFHVFGKGESKNRFWPSLVKSAKEGKDFKMTKGDIIRDFIDVNDLSLMLLDYIEKIDLKDGKPIITNVGTGKPKRLLDFAEYWWNKLGATGNLIPGAIPSRKNEIMRFVPEL